MCSHQWETLRAISGEALGATSVGLGPDFFSDYNAPVSELVLSFGLTPQCYADYTQIYCLLG